MDFHGLAIGVKGSFASSHPFELFWCVLLGIHFCFLPPKVGPRLLELSSSPGQFLTCDSIALLTRRLWVRRLSLWRSRALVLFSSRGPCHLVRIAWSVLL